MVVRVNGGIINSQTLTGSIRFFKMTGPFAWTVSDGSVNLPQVFRGGDPAVSQYYVVGEDRPVPNSAAELALREISKKADIVIINLVPGTYSTTTEIHFACSASAFGWGSDTPAYGVPPANTDEDLTAAAGQMESAVQALGQQDVFVSVGAANSAAAPVVSTVDMSTVTIAEVPFVLA